MKIFKNILIILLAFTVHQAFAQNSEEVMMDQLADQYDLEVTLDEDLNNQLSVFQEGYSHYVEASQTHRGAAGVNELYLVQYGSMNSADLWQNGSGNFFQGNQDGYNNWIESSVNGNSNYVFIGQDGDNNRVEQTLTGDDMSYTIIQTGNENEVIQLENGMTSKEYTVTQTGNNMQVTIENGVYY